MPEIKAESLVQRAAQVAQREIGGEVLLVPVRTSPEQELGIFTLNVTAGFLWNRLTTATRVEVLALALCERFDVEPATALADAIAVCQQLFDAGVLQLSTGGQGAPP